MNKENRPRTGSLLAYGDRVLAEKRGMLAALLGSLAKVDDGQPAANGETPEEDARF